VGEGLEGDVTFPELIIGFLDELGEKISGVVANKDTRYMHKVVLDCEKYGQYLEEKKEKILESWEDSFFNYYHKSQNSEAQENENKNGNAVMADASILLDDKDPKKESPNTQAAVTASTQVGTKKTKRTNKLIG
jgi:hypothetical protein